MAYEQDFDDVWMMEGIRLANQGDVANLVALDKLSHASSWTAQHFAFALANHVVYVVERRQQLLGLIVWQRVADEMELHLIAVDPAYRRQGLAQSLLNQMLIEAHTHGVGRIFLEVRAKNAGAYALYQKNGFVPIATRPRYYGDDDALVLEKSC